MGSLAALLPLALRLRHPKTQLAYNHLVLVVCVVLPLIQPWHSTIVFSGVGVASAGSSWKWIAAGILVAGCVVRLGWLVAGGPRIRCFPKRATRSTASS